MEQKMQNKKPVFVVGFLIVVVGAAAFLAGRMLNGGVSPLGLFGLGGQGGVMSFSVNIVPAEELPKTPPEVTGPFVERKDNTIVVSSVPLDAGGGDVVVQTGGGEGESAGPITSMDMTSGPKVEVVITSDTIIYRDTTQPPSGNSGMETIQQTVEESMLDDLNSDSMVRVWGRKSGDRIIAEVLFYSSPVVFKKP